MFQQVPDLPADVPNGCTISFLANGDLMAAPLVRVNGHRAVLRRGLAGSANVLEVTDDTFDSLVLNAKEPVVVDFYAE